MPKIRVEKYDNSPWWPTSSDSKLPTSQEVTENVESLASSQKSTDNNDDRQSKGHREDDIHKFKSENDVEDGAPLGSDNNGEDGAPLGSDNSGEDGAPLGSDNSGDDGAPLSSDNNGGDKPPPPSGNDNKKNDSDKPDEDKEESEDEESDQNDRNNEKNDSDEPDEDKEESEDEESDPNDREKEKSKEPDEIDHRLSNNGTNAHLNNLDKQQSEADHINEKSDVIEPKKQVQPLMLPTNGLGQNVDNFENPTSTLISNIPDNSSDDKSPSLSPVPIEAIIGSYYIDTGKKDKPEDEEAVQNNREKETGFREKNETGDRKSVIVTKTCSENVDEEQPEIYSIDEQCEEKEQNVDKFEYQTSALNSELQSSDKSGNDKSSLSSFAACANIIGSNSNCEKDDNNPNNEKSVHNDREEKTISMVQVEIGDRGSNIFTNARSDNFDDQKSKIDPTNEQCNDKSSLLLPESNENIDACDDDIAVKKEKPKDEESVQNEEEKKAISTEQNETAARRSDIVTNVSSDNFDDEKLKVEQCDLIQPIEQQNVDKFKISTSALKNELPSSENISNDKSSLLSSASIKNIHGHNDGGEKEKYNDEESVQKEEEKPMSMEQDETSDHGSHFSVNTRLENFDNQQSMIKSIDDQCNNIQLIEQNVVNLETPNSAIQNEQPQSDNNDDILSFPDDDPLDTPINGSRRTRRTCKRKNSLSATMEDVNSENVNDEHIENIKTECQPAKKLRVHNDDLMIVEQITENPVLLDSAESLLPDIIEDNNMDKQLCTKELLPELLLNRPQSSLSPPKTPNTSATTINWSPSRSQCHHRNCGRPELYCSRSPPMSSPEEPLSPEIYSPPQTPTKRRSTRILFTPSPKNTSGEEVCSTTQHQSTLQSSIQESTNAKQLEKSLACKSQEIYDSYTDTASSPESLSAKDDDDDARTPASKRPCPQEDME